MAQDTQTRRRDIWDRQPRLDQVQKLITEDRYRDSYSPLFDRTNMKVLSQTPQHDEKAWKKHWDDNSLLPDQIYIAARQRAKNEVRIFEEHESVLSPAPTPSVGSNDELPADRRSTQSECLAACPSGNGALFVREESRLE